MSWKRGAAVAFSAALGGLLPVSGCADLFGFQLSGDVVQCVRNSDCADGLVCANNLCGAPCGDTTSSVDNCGSCGHACTGGHFHWTCADSVCIQDGCETGWGNCDSDAGGGCEDNLASDGMNCSYCGNSCPSTVCSDASCLAPEVIPALPSPSAAAAYIPVNSELGDSNEAELVGIQIQITVQAVLVSIGIATSLGGPHGYLGLYQDENGQPTTRLATTGEFMLLGNSKVDNDPLATVVPVLAQVTLAPGYYWILGDWDQSVVIQLAQGTIGCKPGAPGCPIGCVQGDSDCFKWYKVPQPFGPVPSTIVGGLFVYYPQPLIYVNLAQ